MRLMYSVVNGLYVSDCRLFSASRVCQFCLWKMSIRSVLGRKYCARKLGRDSRFYPASLFMVPSVKRKFEWWMPSLT